MARCAYIALHSIGPGSGRQTSTVINAPRSSRRSGDKLCTRMCTRGGRTTKTWGLPKTSGDNPGDSKIPLDLGFLLREGMPRTGQRTPTGAETPAVRRTPPGDPRAAAGSAHETEAGSDGARNHLALGTESTGNRRPRAQGIPGQIRRSTPTAPTTRFGGATLEGTGNRVSVNGVEKRRSRLAGRPGFDSGNGVRFAGRRGRGGTAAGKPAARPECDGRRNADETEHSASRRWPVRR